MECQCARLFSSLKQPLGDLLTQARHLLGFSQVRARLGGGTKVTYPVRLLGSQHSHREWIVLVLLRRTDPDERLTVYSRVTRQSIRLHKYLNGPGDRCCILRLALLRDIRLENVSSGTGAGMVDEKILWRWCHKREKWAKIAAPH